MCVLFSMCVVVVRCRAALLNSIVVICSQCQCQGHKDVFLSSIFIGVAIGTVVLGNVYVMCTLTY